MDFESWFAADAAALLRILLVGVSTYFYLIVLLRVSGKRTLSKLSAFDLVVTVALGSTLSTIMLDRSISVVEGALALALLAGCQFVVAWGGTRSKSFHRLTHNDPTLLVLRGMVLEKAMREERIVEADIRSALRAAGLSEMGEAVSVVLESDGSLSVIQADVGSLPSIVQ